MISTTSIFAMVVAAANIVDHVQSHGFIANPPPSWKKGKNENQEWVVQIEPQWKGDWDKATSDQGLLDTFKELGAANNFKSARSLMDGNPVYGADCGYTDPNGTPVDPPSDGTATFSRPMKHAGLCEIWINKKMVLQNDDCQSAYGDKAMKKKSVLKPIDYSSCKGDKCLLRFYWLALQRIGDKTVWQAYKNCISIKGSSGGEVGRDADPSQLANANSTQVPPQDSNSDGENNSSTDSNSSTESATFQQNSADESVIQMTGDSISSSPLNETHDETPVPAPGSKCHHRR
ncbi:uncharacterized protein PHALS_05394 [Plasmopara halstedii]|uniref:RxLR-like protein n=1 Tax=Plasmopara halstedii TaxID=4781 RepID=A0A0P1A9U8_PLAHL|nr:uncharacterized protein PHALS_05394 [Plasmopara halstedii]CEG37615.1 hypothetical protein PHALS_05394 [Plasmopara halstedii]|eukprot:XP_024573984.1 hypothetical protein PHALS_05394 [Plasmopara halstedii]